MASTFTCELIAAILRRLAPDRLLAGVVLFLWNPVVLYETIGQGHNDVAMLFWMAAPDPSA